MRTQQAWILGGTLVVCALILTTNDRSSQGTPRASAQEAPGQVRERPAVQRDSAPPRPAPLAVGRYQIATGRGRTSFEFYLVDTATGHCWARTVTGKWVDMGTPPVARPAEKPVP